MTLPDMEKPRVTEIQVRMDCNGCVQKIKKALHGINGINDLYIDFPQQKITIIGWADPHKIAKAIKKTGKTAIICSHSEPFDDPPSEPAPPGTEGGNQPAAEEEAPPQPSLPVPENPPSEAANSTPTNQPPVQTSKPKDAEEIHVIHHHVQDGYRPFGYSGSPAPGLISVELHQPTYVTHHSYSAYNPLPYVTYINRPSPYARYYGRPADQYSYITEEHHSVSNGNVTSIFSDENPNACRIV
ncbi:heavy metal-associated isoprenylated plant 5-like [Olea europaea subsp. europaea]|nr:heavy metal-associated isoprenylated plant 5-like [Olea europaea subsp. europaea]